MVVQEYNIIVTVPIPPFMVTDIVLAPVVAAMRYHSSVDFVPVLVVLARVKEPPFHEARVIVPVPATSWKISAELIVTVSISIFFP